MLLWPEERAHHPHGHLRAPLQVDRVKALVVPCLLPSRSLTTLDSHCVHRQEVEGVSEALEALYAGEVEKAHELLPPDEQLSVFEAAAFGRLDALRWILDADPAQATALSDDGFTALHLAVFGGQEEAVRLLLERGADPNALSTNEAVRVPPLGTAAFVRSVPLARLLLDSGADVNGRGEGGFTALHSAAQNGDGDLARLLLERGADKSLATDDGRLPADYGLRDFLS
jgi:ankyrin repeat protein